MEFEIQGAEPSFEPRTYSVQGIEPSRLRDAVKNTVPFFFDSLNDPPDYFSNLGSVPISISDYFKQCLSAHFATVATLVPTDVDPTIRVKLWEQCPSEDLAWEMTEIAMESKNWDIRPVSCRYVISKSHGVLSGHDGERFSVLAAAFGYWSRRRKADRVREEILSELDRERAIGEEALSQKDGIHLLKVSTIIAHNLGDLERVLDEWKVKDEIAIQNKVFYRLGELNKKLMAAENHRHLSLRPVRGLRRSAEFFLPIGPFFEAWGKRVASTPLLTQEEKAEVVRVLYEGWERLKRIQGLVTDGYPRALRGFVDGFSGGMKELSKYLPSRLARDISEGEFRKRMEPSAESFHASMNKRAWSALP